MILIDSSAWIEFLRDRGDLYVKRVVEAIVCEDKALLCGPVRMEVLGGARKNERKRLAEAFNDLRYVRTGEALWRDVINYSHTLRDQGLTLPWNDILIASIAARACVAVYSIDKHFTHMTDALGLRSYRPGYNGMFNPDY